MKKAMSLLLALVLCLSLCACGVDKKYTPLLENLDAGNYDGVKDALTELSPEFKADVEKLEKYQSLIDLLEAENYEDALVDVENRIPVPECEVIEITMDNWDEYFEIVPDHYWHENAFGEGDSLSCGFSLFLKDEYIAQFHLTGNSEIACTIAFDAREKTLDIHWKEKKFTEMPYADVGYGMSWSGLDDGRSLDHAIEESCSSTCELRGDTMIPLDRRETPDFSLYHCSNMFYNCHYPVDYADFYNVYFGENFSMVRITGTLELLTE